ncbi:fimbrial protein [Serratia microhaemolytica]|uniref:fimbrial protein n=1 Tax=Serratia microhaemolytica TaxID=2675110 RepID=UPI0012D74D4A|nr:type 1 fimbrial protein [Serratia microhaemolytica]
MSTKKNVILAVLFSSLAGSAMVANAAPYAEVLLYGVITNSTCDVVANKGQATLNVGVFKTKEFAVDTQTARTVALPVELTNCAGDEVGELIIQGQASGNNENLFVSKADNTVGFMIKGNANQQVQVGKGVTVPVSKSGPNKYEFRVGMGSTTASPKTGNYSVPITVAYIVN